VSEREGSVPDAGSPPGEAPSHDAALRPDGGSSGSDDNRRPSVAESLAELKADRILAEARREARAIIDSARVDARREARGIVDAARTEAEDIITEAFEERARIVRRDWAIGDFSPAADEVAASDATATGHRSNGDGAAPDTTTSPTSGEVAGVPAAADPAGDPAQFERPADESVAARAAEAGLGPAQFERPADESVAARAAAPGPGSAETDDEINNEIEEEPDSRPPAAPPDRTVPVPARAASRGGGSTSVLGELIESPGIVEPFRRPRRRVDAPAARDASPETPPRVWPARLPRPGETLPPPGAKPQFPPPPPSRRSSQSSPLRPPVAARPGPGQRRIPEAPPAPASPAPRLPSRLSGTEVPRPASPGVPRIHPESDPPTDPSNTPGTPGPPDRPDGTSAESQVVARRRVERELPAGMRIPPDVPDWDDPFDDSFDDEHEAD
jgi:hypothetical protein